MLGFVQLFSKAVEEYVVMKAWLLHVLTCGPLELRPDTQAVSPNHVVIWDWRKSHNHHYDFVEDASPWWQAGQLFCSSRVNILTENRETEK